MVQFPFHIRKCECDIVACNFGFEVDYEACQCVAPPYSGANTEPEFEYQTESELYRRKRMSDSRPISKLIRGEQFTTQASSDRCNHDEHWNGISCIPLITLCQGGYHWNGHSCIIQSTIKTAALVPSPPGTECPLRAKQNEENVRSEQIPLTVVPTISTSPMCPFGFVWSGDKCISNPPSCPPGYIFRSNVCHLTAAQSNIKESATEPTMDDFLDQSNENEDKMQQKPFETDMHQKCCLVMSPRICRRIDNNQSEQWQCFHYSDRKCSEFCIKPKIFLRPKNFLFVEPFLIVPPLPRRLQKLMQKDAYRGTNIDCSECLNGSYGCSSECFAYECNSNDCEFINEDLLCGKSSNKDDNSGVNIDDYGYSYNDICTFTSTSTS